MAALWPFDAEQEGQVGTSVSRWLFIDPDQSRLRGVLVSYVQTPECSVFLFEIERRKVSRTTEGGQKYADEESFCGLIVVAPALTSPGDWIPKVFDGIRRQRGVMQRVLSYCPGTRARDYRRSTSSTD